MTRIFALVVVTCVTAAAGDAAEECSSAATGREILAEVNGQALNRTDFNHRVSARVFQARNAYYDAERQALEEVVDEMLLEQQAREENTTVPQLLERHVNSVIAPDPPEQALRVYYEGLNVTEPFEAVKDRIVTHLRERRIANGKTAYLQSLRKAGKVTVNLAPPRLRVPVGSMPMRGSASAPVQIVEYADYECSYCQQIQPALKKLAEQYSDKVSFVYKDIPLPMHPDAQKAAEAKYCAAAQGKYWEYHDLLVSKKQYKKQDLFSNATALQLNLDEFEKCLESGEQAGVVAAHVREAQAFGLQGTPTLFINGRIFSGALTYEKLREIVEEELRAAQSAPAQSAMR